MARIIIEKGKSKPRISLTDNVYLSIIFANKKADQKAISFRFERESVRNITKNGYIQLSYDIEESKIYFEQSTPETGYLISQTRDSLPCVRTTTVREQDFSWFEENQGSYALQWDDELELHYIDIKQHEKEKAREYQRQYYSENRDKINSYQREYNRKRNRKGGKK